MPKLTTNEKRAVRRELLRAVLWAVSDKLDEHTLGSQDQYGVSASNHIDSAIEALAVGQAGDRQPPHVMTVGRRIEELFKLAEYAALQNAPQDCCGSMVPFYHESECPTLAADES